MLTLSANASLVAYLYIFLQQLRLFKLTNLRTTQALQLEAHFPSTACWEGYCIAARTVPYTLVSLHSRHSTAARWTVQRHSVPLALEPHPLRSAQQSSRCPTPRLGTGPSSSSSTITSTTTSSFSSSSSSP